MILNWHKIKVFFIPWDSLFLLILKQLFQRLINWIRSKALCIHLILEENKKNCLCQAIAEQIVNFDFNIFSHCVTYYLYAVFDTWLLPTHFLLSVDCSPINMVNLHLIKINSIIASFILIRVDPLSVLGRTICQFAPLLDATTELKTSI